MYWLVLILALEGDKGVLVNEHWLEPVSVYQDTCRHIAKKAYVDSTSSSFIFQGRFICKKRDTLVKQRE